MNRWLADLTSGDDARAEAAIPALVDEGPAAARAIIELTHDNSADVRWWAVRALAAFPLARTEDLVPLLGDSAPEVRAAAALALCDVRHEGALPALIDSLSDADALVADLAGNALVKIGSPSVPALLNVMEAHAELRRSARLAVRIRALRALAEIRDHRAIPIMMKAMSEDSTLLQYWAQQGLERLGLDMVYIKP